MIWYSELSEHVYHLLSLRICICMRQESHDYHNIICESPSSGLCNALEPLAYFVVYSIKRNKRSAIMQKHTQPYSTFACERHMLQCFLFLFCPKLTCSFHPANASKVGYKLGHRVLFVSEFGILYKKQEHQTTSSMVQHPFHSS